MYSNLGQKFIEDRHANLCQKIFENRLTYLVDYRSNLPSLKKLSNFSIRALDSTKSKILLLLENNFEEFLPHLVCYYY